MVLPIAAIVAGTLVTIGVGEATKYLFQTKPVNDQEDEFLQSKVKVNQTPTTVYNTTNNTYIIDVSSKDISPPELPPLRLPEEADGQTPFETPRGRSINIKKSVYKHEYGKLLYRPIINEKLKVNKYDNQTKLEKNFEKAQEEGLNKLTEYITGRDFETAELLDKPIPFEETGILLTPESLKGFSGEYSALFGAKSLNILNQAYTGRAMTAYMPIRTVAYKDYDEIKKNPEKELNYKKKDDKTKNEEAEYSGLTLTHISKFYDLLGLDILFQRKDLKLVIDDLLEKFGNALYQEIDEGAETDEDNPDANIKYKERAYQFDNLIDLFTCIAASMYWKNGLNQFPITAPKDLTNLPDFSKLKEESLRERDLDEQYFKSDDKLNLNQEDEKLKPEDIEEDWENKDKYYTQINSISEFVSWQTKQLDAILGMYPITAEIEDTDLIKVGEQGLKISLPNISETLAELTKYALLNSASNEALLNIALRNLQEVGSNKIQSISSYSLLESISDYLGFKMKKSEKEIEFTFNPLHGSNEKEAESLSEALKPSKIKIPIEEYDDDVSLEKHLVALLEAARIIKARFFRTVNTKDISSLKTLFTSTLDLLNNETNKDKPDSQSDFELFTERVEKGFTDAPGISDSNHPYGKNFDNRPKIKEIGKEPKNGES